MSVLSDKDIRNAIDDRDLSIIVPDGVPGNNEVLIQPSSIDLRLSPIIQVVKPELADEGEAINPTQLKNIQKKLEGVTETRKIDRVQPFVMEPNAFVLATTAEIVKLSNRVAARVEGKSSLARFGIAVHLTAPKIDPGWIGNITLEIINLGPHNVSLSPYMEIAVLMIDRLSSPATQVYEGKFNASPN